MNQNQQSRPASTTTNDTEPDMLLPTTCACTESEVHEAPLIPEHLARLSSEGVDPCDLAETAMPDLVIGDLAPPDEAWVRSHTLTCSYCANLLNAYEEVCSTLEECDSLLASGDAGIMAPPVTRLGLSSLRYGYMESPVGDILLGISDEGVADISYLAEQDVYEKLRDLENRGFLVYERQDAVADVAAELQDYFAHRRQQFDVPVDLRGISDFTRRVLKSSRQIPYGKVWTYGDVARDIGRPGASRAVGNALGRNPIPVIIPCHRVILSSGAMGWYTGGPEIKRALLGIEGVTWAHETQQPLVLET